MYRSCAGYWLLLCSVIFSLTALAQPTLPDIAGSRENGVALISWTCQYDGVKSIAVLRSADSNFNYSTIGFVKKLYKGTQGYADGHPMPGMNYYKLSIVFASGLTWGSNHAGVYVDSLTALKDSRLPPNEQLQKLIVTEPEKQVATTTPVKNVTNPQPGSKVAPADRDKYMEVVRKEKKDTVRRVETSLVRQTVPKPQYTVDRDATGKAARGSYLQQIPQEMLDRMDVTYSDDTLDEDEDDTDAAPKKVVNMTFKQKDDAAAFVSTLPKDDKKKFTITYNDNAGATNKGKDDTTAGKKVVTTHNNSELRTYLDKLPDDKKGKVTISYNVDSADLHTQAMKEQVIAEAPAPPKPKISIRFADDENVNAAADVRSRYIFNDAVSGNITMTLPDDIVTHHYSVKFYDGDGHMVIEIPRLNNARVILDKRNFQHKGQYRFVLRRDVVELESGFINIY